MYQVVGVTWSSNGASIAVGYGKTDHVSWCEHQSSIAIWSIFRREFEAKKPTLTIEVPNCLTCIEFHPQDPLILAGGTINGEIFIWNVGAEGSNSQIISKSDADEYFHREPIRRINWLTFESVNSLALSMALVTISSDGKILMWNNPLKALRYPIKGHMTARVKNNSLQILGGTSLAMVTGAFGLDENAFIVGTEGGVVQKCLI
mgnify:CR=1 FL=1